jgi:hypothetical protein
MEKSSIAIYWSGSVTIKGFISIFITARESRSKYMVGTWAKTGSLLVKRVE